MGREGRSHLELEDACVLGAVGVGEQLVGGRLGAINEIGVEDGCAKGRGEQGR